MLSTSVENNIFSTSGYKLNVSQLKFIIFYLKKSIISTKVNKFKLEIFAENNIHSNKRNLHGEARQTDTHINSTSFVS